MSEAKPTFESMNAHFFGYSKSNDYVFVERIGAFDNETASFWTVQTGNYADHIEASLDMLSLSVKTKFYKRATLFKHLDLIGLVS